MGMRLALVVILTVGGVTVIGWELIRLVGDGPRIGHMSNLRLVLAAVACLLGVCLAAKRNGR